MGQLKAKAGLAWQLISDAADEFSKDRGDLVAAALAFFAMLSVAPLIIIAVAIAGILLGEATARQEIQGLLTETMGAAPAGAVDEWVEQASAGGGIASVVGGALFLWTASRLGGALKVALNQVWNVDVELEESFKSTLASYVRRRAFAFLLVLSSGPLLLATFLSRALVSGVGSALMEGSGYLGPLVSVGQFLFSLLVLFVGCTLVFRFVPDTRVGWKVSAVGGLATSVLINLGNLLLGFYLGTAEVGAAYGIASSVAVALLWFYYSSLIFLFGAELTQVWAVRFGRGLGPEEEREQSALVNKAERERSKRAAVSRSAPS